METNVERIFTNKNSQGDLVEELDKPDKYGVTPIEDGNQGYILTVKNVELTDAGIYRCVLLLGGNGATAQLVVLGKVFIKYLLNISCSTLLLFTIYPIYQLSK